MAVQAQRIHDLEESPDLAEKPETLVGDVLLVAIYKLGIRANNIPDEDALNILVEFLKTHYGNHTLAEINLAFDLAFTGQLDIQDVSCYDNFSCFYLSKILNSYRRWASNTFKQNERIMLPPNPASQEDLGDQAMLDWLSEIRKKKPDFEFLPVMLYDWLEKRGEIKKSKKEKLQYLERAVTYRQGQLAKEFARDTRNLKALQDFNAMKEKGYLEGPEIEKVKRLAKLLIFEDYLNASSGQ